MYLFQIRLSIFTNEVEVFYMVFNSVGSTRIDWFSQDRMLESSVSDLNAASPSPECFSLDGLESIRFVNMCSPKKSKDQLLAN